MPKRHIIRMEPNLDLGPIVRAPVSRPRFTAPDMSWRRMTHDFGTKKRGRS